VTERARVSRIAAVIFDMDGLMVDTEPFYQLAWQQAAAELGHELHDTLYAKFVGRPTADCERLLEAHGPSFPLPAFRIRWPELWRSEIERAGVRAASWVVANLHQGRDLLARLIGAD
jgi:beta-phosphoglucomutase-like phosphatase (HAD superfamily)